MSSKWSNCLCAFMLALAPGGHGQTNPLLNADFESWSGGTPVNWAVSGKSYLAQENNERYSGSFSARLKIPTTSTTVELSQDIAVTGGAVYSFSCRILDNTPDGEAALMVNWRNSGGDLSTRTSGHSSDQSAWQAISLANQQAPAEATIARIRVRGYQQAGAGGGYVYADEITLSGDFSLSVHLSGMEAEPVAGGVQIRWTTESEIQTCGFRIYRAEFPEGPFEEVTNALIPSRGAGSSRVEYSFVDAGAGMEAEFWYRLEEEDQEGNLTALGMVRVSSGRGNALLPSETALGNYPNPFNPVTTLFYSIPEDLAGKRIRIEIFDLLGRRILKMADDFMNPGRHSVLWNGRDEAGLDVPSGAYLCRMTGEEGVLDARRMMKMK
jgi:hypothetical protein